MQDTGVAMIYLFNSAIKETYIENVYRLVGLPQGVYIDVRYTEATNAPGVETDIAIKGSDCIVCYIDRFAERYQYFPFRKGTIRSIKREHKRVYYSVELKEHCHTQNPKEFTRFLQAANPVAPRLNGEPTNSNDGIYCVSGPDAPGVHVEGDSWAKAVDQIYGTRSFLAEAPALFFVDIAQKGKRPHGSRNGLRLHANTEYDISVHYRYPYERGDGAARRILVRMGSELNRELSVGSPSDRLILPISLPPLDFSAGAIVIETTMDTPGSGGGLVRYTATVPFRTSAWRANLILFGLLFLIAFLGEFFKADWNFYDRGAWGATFYEFLKFGIVIWAVFKYRGKLSLPGL